MATMYIIDLSGLGLVALAATLCTYAGYLFHTKVSAALAKGILIAIFG